MKKKKQTEKKQKKPTLIDKISASVEKYFSLLCVLLLIGLILAPVLVWLFYSVIPCNVVTDITADGMLSYVGAAIASVASLFVACIALYQSKRAYQAEQKLVTQTRMNEICPRIQINVEKNADGTFTLEISNYGVYVAIGIYLFDCSFLPLVKPGEKQKRKFVVDKPTATGVSIERSYVEINGEGYPKSINLIYGDVDNNIISQDFKLVQGNKYEAQPVDYC